MIFRFHSLFHCVIVGNGLINGSCFEIEKMTNVQNSVISTWACLQGYMVTRSHRGLGFKVFHDRASIGLNA